MIGDSDTEFIIPVYSETDAECPQEVSVKIYENDCVTLSAAFENSADLMSTLSNGTMKAKLVNQQVP